MGPLVTTDWLAAELGKPDLVVFDATKYLPNEPKDGSAEFLRAHIPGARYFDIDRDRRSRHRSAAHGARRRALRRSWSARWACRNTSRVVFYDQKGLASAARGWWLMGLFGHDNAAVLDGGLPKWLARDAQRKPASRAPAARHSSPITAPPACAASATCCANLETQTELVLDARAAARFSGEAPEPRAGMRCGHIPGAANLPYTDLLNADAPSAIPPACAPALRRPASMDATGGDQLRHRRHRLHPHAWHARSPGCRRAPSTTAPGPNGAAAPTRRWRPLNMSRGPPAEEQQLRTAGCSHAGRAGKRSRTASSIRRCIRGSTVLHPTRTPTGAQPGRRGSNACCATALRRLTDALGAGGRDRRDRRRHALRHRRAPASPRSPRRCSRS